MTIAAKSIIQRVVEAIQDKTSIRWPVDELVRYLNDGQREIILYRPDANVKSAAFTCAAGTRQELPTGGAKLMDVVRNASTNSESAVRLVSREILDAQMPNWHALPGKEAVLHFMFDARDPRVFYVYPPALATSKLDILYAAYPQDVTEPAEGATANQVAGNIDVPDIYGNVLQDYILYRAYRKDSEYAGNAERAAAYYQTFANALGIEVKGTIATMPVTLGNPNVVRGQAAAQ